MTHDYPYVNSSAARYLSVLAIAVVLGLLANAAAAAALPVQKAGVQAAAQVKAPTHGLQITTKEAYILCLGKFPPCYPGPGLQVRYYPYLVITNANSYPVTLSRFTSRGIGNSISVYADGMTQTYHPLSDITLASGDSVCFGTDSLPRNPSCNKAIVLTNFVDSHDNSLGSVIQQCGLDPISGSVVLSNFSIEYSNSMAGRSTPLMVTDSFGDLSIPCLGGINPS